MYMVQLMVASAVVDRPIVDRIGDKTANLRKYDMSTEILFWQHK